MGYELTWVTLYHILSWCYHYLDLSIHFERKEGHELLQIIHQDDFLIISLLIFRDDHSEYEDRMDISKLVLKDPLEKQATQASSSFSSEGIVE